jgi:omega-6 fatty acid desaturase (delta-12 desaturase)
MYLSIDVSYWLTFLLAFPATGFVVRIFIIQHDCGHGSFFKSQKANDLIGMFCSLLTLTPYHYWRTTHSIHHAGVGKLEARGIGDVHTKTVAEYLALSRWGRFKYRFYRNPLILFVIVPTVLFLILYRFPNYKHKKLVKFQKSIYTTSLIIASLMGALIWLIGIKDFLLIQLPITIITSSTGAWLFFVQHQFEDTYWENKEDWDFATAALEGSSYYKLPKVLQWFTGNIGFHHIHHLSPKIPNYLLEKCQKENPMFQKARTLTLRSSLHSIFLTLWDEKQKKLISFRRLKHLQLDIQH